MMEKTFFVDAMLGNISTKLRLLGYDTEYSADIQDDELIKQSRKERRIIVSKDYQMISKATKLNLSTIHLKTNTEKAQIIEIMHKLGIKKLNMSGKTARCPKCNCQTELFDKKNVQGAIPNRILEINNEFWKCENCNQIYWEGTHIKNLKKLIDEINERL